MCVCGQVRVQVLPHQHDCSEIPSRSERDDAPWAEGGRDCASSTAELEHLDNSPASNPTIRIRISLCVSSRGLTVAEVQWRYGVRHVRQPCYIWGGFEGQGGGVHDGTRRGLIVRLKR